MLLIAAEIKAATIIFRLSVRTVVSGWKEGGIGHTGTSYHCLHPFAGFSCTVSQGYYGRRGPFQFNTPLALVRFTFTGCYWKGAGFAAAWRE